MGGEQIIVRVGPDGSVQAETKGIKGPKCLDSIQLLEDLLEAETVASAFTDEYNGTSTANNVSGDSEVNDDLRQY